MLQSIRDRTQGWIAGAIVSVLILSFALWGIHSYLNESTNNSSVAKVNGIEITKEQLAVAYERLRRQLQMQFNSNYQLPEQAESNLKERALHALINIQVLKQASLNENYRISSRQIDSFLESMPEFQVNGQFSQTRFQQILETTLYNASDFLELIKTSLLIDQPRLGLIFTSFALPNEITDTIALLNQERDIKYIVFTPQLVLKNPIQISSDKIQKYYNEHQNEFKTPEQVTVDYVELSLKNLISTIHPDEQTLRNFYNENASSFAQSMKWKLESIIVPLSANANQQEVEQTQKKADAIFNQAKTGKEFSILTQEYSLDNSKNKLQGWFSINEIPSDFQKIILKLTKPGDLSDPIRFQNGFILFKVKDIKESSIQSFEQIKNKVSDFYVHQQAEEKFADLRDKLEDTSYKHPDSLDETAKKLNLNIKTSELFSKEKGGNDISANNKIREAAFSNEVLNLKNNSDVIQISGDSAIVLRIKTHSSAALLPLKAVENQIIQKLKTTEIELRLTNLVTEIKNNLQRGMDQSKIIQQYKLRWEDTGFIGRHSNKVNSAILDAAFKLPKPQNNNYSYAMTKIPLGYAVIALVGIHEGTVANNKEQYKVFAQQIQNAQGLIEYEMYKQSLMKRAKITTVD